MGILNVKWAGSAIKQDASNRLVTDEEKTAWTNKADKDHEHDVATIDELLGIYDEMQLEVPATIDDVTTSVAAVNVALNDLKANVYNHFEGKN